jgi:hypothetical protein
MSNKRIKSLIVLFVIILAAGLGVLLYLKRVREERVAAEQQETAKLAEKRELQRRIDQLVSRTNAVTKWREEFSSSVESPFSAEVTRELIRPDGRPLLFKGEAQDVAQREEKYVCSFGINLNMITTARLVLSCEPSIAQEILRRGHGESYAVVARISSVASYDEVNTDSASGESNEPSDDRRFKVRGTELGQEFLDGYYSDLDDKLEILGRSHQKGTEN